MVGQARMRLLVEGMHLQVELIQATGRMARVPRRICALLILRMPPRLRLGTLGLTIRLLRIEPHGRLTLYRALRLHSVLDLGADSPLLLNLSSLSCRPGRGRRHLSQVWDPPLVEGRRIILLGPSRKLLCPT